MDEDDNEGSIEKLSKEDLTMAEFDPVLQNKSDSVRIKLVITDIAHTDAEKNVRKLFSPIVSPFLPKFGMFHSALIIGKNLFEIMI